MRCRRAESLHVVLGRRSFRVSDELLDGFRNLDRRGSLLNDQPVWNLHIRRRNGDHAELLLYRRHFFEDIAAKSVQRYWRNLERSNRRFVQLRTRYTLNMERKEVDVLIVGAGPAGMVMACLLARAGLKVLVAEKNKDFEREFRGEILQPRFHRAMMDAGLFDHIQKYPHEEVESAHAYFMGRKLAEIPLNGLDPGAGTTWWMTQPNLLRALHDYAQTYPGYEIWFETGLKEISQGTAVLRKADQEVEVQAKVVVGADGRFSTVRRLVQAQVRYDRHDMDVLWFTLPRPEGYRHVFSFFLSFRRNYLILPKHPNLLQCGLALKPGEFSKIQKKGVSVLQSELRRAHPLFRSFADRLENFSVFHSLKGNRAYVRQWAGDGWLLIGDAAHTCSPAGGIGVSIAAETACVAAGVVHDAFAQGDFSAKSLGRVQRLRDRQVRAVHAIQGQAQLAIRTPAWIRILIPLALWIGNFLRLGPLVASRLLTQKGELPLFRLARGARYSDALSVRQAIEVYFQRSRFGRETYTERWVRLPIGPFTLYLPNLPPRKRVVPLHDVNHLVCEYDTNWRGEMSITGFELGVGIGRYWFGWIIILQGLWIGLLFYPRDLWQGFVRGRRTRKSLYRTYPYSEALLNMSLGELRNQLGLAEKHAHLQWGDIPAFIGLALISLVLHSPFLVFPLWIIHWLR